MELSAPIYRLKRKARLLSREKNIALNEALDRIAVEEGCKTWSLLVARLAASAPATRLLDQLSSGDLMLLGARPGHGKTLMSIRLAIEAMKRGRQAAFFTLEYTEQEVLRRFREIGATEAQLSDLFRSDCSEDINAGYIMRAMSAAGAGSLVVVDYLQALDQKRTNPELAVQVRDLKAFARDRGAIVVLISQIHRSYDTAQKTCPDLRDVRLPNPLDVGLFDKSCFLNEGKVRIHAT